VNPGTTLGHYRLVEKLGEGGMGVVWRALDTTLDREVAIKILPDMFEQHPDRLERFEREAKVLAQLQHPNIAVVHGLHEDQNKRFLVMELVDGEDLSERLARGPLPTVEAMKLCAQVARALQAAHDRNVVHRDLKPANIVLTASGEAKVLDFGLAKVLDPDAPAEGEQTSAPTVTTGGTVVGTILGTAAYMSPEQARGKATDRRTDIWSFGCVLHECLTGVSEFRGDTMSDSIGAILHKSPDWDALPADLPVTIHWLLRRCLTKDRDNRLHDIADARIELEQAIVDPQAAGVPAAAGAAAGPDTPSRRSWIWPVLAVLLAGLAGLTAWWLKPAPAADRSAVSLSVQLPTPQDSVDFTMSPDGTNLVYRAVKEPTGEEAPPDPRLWLRRLDSFVPTPIPGTEKASMPVFSPDGRMVAYLVDRDSGGSDHHADLRVAGLDGRPPLTVATNATDHSPPAWLSADEIVYVDHDNEKRLLAISRGGGNPRVYAELPEKSSFSSFTFLLAGDRGWIATNPFVDALPVITLIDPASGEEFPLLQDATGARILDDGRLLFLRGNVLLFAQIDLDVSPPKLVGEVKTVMGSGTDPTDRIQHVAVSEAGHLAFVRGEGPNQSRRLMTVDRDGKVEVLVEAKGSYAVPVGFSPDGRLLSVAANDLETPSAMWIVELDTGARRPMAPKERIACGGCWVPDDRIVLTAWDGIAQGSILIRELRRNAEPQPLFDDWPENLRLIQCRVSFDGANVAFETMDQSRGDPDIWMQPLDGSAEPRPLVATEAAETFPSFSPDGRRLAYTSNESGRREIYVRTHSTEAASESTVVKASRSGGNLPLWSADGSELFFFDWPNNRMMGVRMESDDPLRLSEPYEVIPDLPALRPSRHFEQPELVPMPDGERFVFVQRPEAETKIERIEVVLNWAKQLER
jgi:Tol biopolymer transport system component/predicted Ser/Thr protein kinase